MSAIAVGVDGSGPSRAALAWAVEDAAVRGERLLVVRAFAPHSRRDEELGHSRTAAERRAADQLRRVLAERGGRPAPLADELAGRGAERPEAECATVEGTPAQALLRLAHGAHQVVVGRRGLGPVRRMVMGSVSTRVVRAGPCPVTVVP